MEPLPSPDREEAGTDIHGDADVRAEAAIARARPKGGDDAQVPDGEPQLPLDPPAPEKGGPTS